ncbi:MAG: hypothetical protein DI635_13800 [Pseudoxanthomonas suwonensis]|nr:MAG: hypothetical protein DI635_13800 [Pseudoxanthomonas suwonensis]
MTDAHRSGLFIISALSLSTSFQLKPVEYRGHPGDMFEDRIDAVRQRFGRDALLRGRSDRLPRSAATGETGTMQDVLITCAPAGRSA